MIFVVVVICLCVKSLFYFNKSINFIIYKCFFHYINYIFIDTINYVKELKQTVKNVKKCKLGFSSKMLYLLNVKNCLIFFSNIYTLIIFN